eukprot:TRINITY_DN5941_c0_g1_i3.p1 TRINITY_DN5941_c0_g1~~TRINITY_DN5941_c0_g1_i3.p1  ORF type:complete len:223 (-),score=76.30 TRINITY_DN5941_c0_g1_i3:31-699(-)
MDQLPSSLQGSEKNEAKEVNDGIEAKEPKEATETNEANEITEAKQDRMSERMQKLQELQSKRLEICGKTTEQRIKKMQKDAIRAAKKAGIFGEASLHSNSVREQKAQEDNESAKTKDPLKELRPYMMVNRHLESGPGSQALRKNPKLEKSLDDAILAKDFSKAQQISMRMAQEENSKVLKDAVDAKEYAEKRMEEREQEVKKRRKVHWTFESKQRWETKGNM